MKKTIIGAMMLLGFLLPLNAPKQVYAQEYSFYIYRQDNPSQINDLTIPNDTKDHRFCLGGSDETFTVTAMVNGGNFGSRGYNGQCWGIGWTDVGLTYNFSVKNVPILSLTVRQEQVTTPPVEEETKPEEQPQTPPPVTNSPTENNNNSSNSGNNNTNQNNNQTTTPSVVDETKPEDTPVNNVENEIENEIEVIELIKPEIEINEENGYIIITNPNEIGVIEYSFDNKEWLKYEDTLLINDLFNELEDTNITIYARIIDNENISDIKELELEKVIEEQIENDEDEPTDLAPFIIGGIGGLMAVSSYYILKKRNKLAIENNQTEIVEENTTLEKPNKEVEDDNEIEL